MMRIYFENKLGTVEEIADNIDLFLCGMTSLSNMSIGTCVRFMAHYGLYCKSLKNLGTEKHKQLLYDAI